MFRSAWIILFLTDLQVCSCSQHKQAQHCCHRPEAKESAKIQSCFFYTGAQIQNITSENTLAPRQLKWKQHIQLAPNQYSAKEHLQQLCAELFFHRSIRLWLTNTKRRNAVSLRRQNGLPEELRTVPA